MYARLRCFIFFALIPLISFAKPILDIQHWQTQNGAQVYFVQTPEVPMVQVNVIFAAGSAHDGDKSGLAQLMNEMLNQGTKTLTADQIAEGFDKVGAQFSDTINRDMGIAGLQSLTEPKYLNPALAIFTSIITSPSFPQDAFVRTQKQTLNVIQQQQQAPDVVAKKAFFIALYDKHPYAHPLLGTQQSVSALTPDDLKAFYQQYYVAKNAMMTIVGAVDKTRAEQIANQVLGNLPAGETAASIPAPTAPMQMKVERIAFPSQQTSIVMGQIGIDYNDPNYFPLTVGNYYLGGAPLTSLLFTEVREKRGLSYGVGSTFSPMQVKGPFAVLMQTRNGEAEQSWQVAQDTLKKFMATDMTDANLNLTKNKIINNFPLTLAGNDAISGYLMMIGFYHLPLNYLDTYCDKIQAVTASQVKDAFQKTVDPNKLVTVMVGNFAKTTTQ